MDLQALGWSSSWQNRFPSDEPANRVPGRVAVEHKGRYQVYTAAGEITAVVRGRLRFDAAGRGDFPAVGDWVALTPQPGPSEAMIETILPRVSAISRKAAGATTDEQV